MSTRRARRLIAWTGLLCLLDGARLARAAEFEVTADSFTVANQVNVSSVGYFQARTSAPADPALATQLLTPGGLYFDATYYKVWDRTALAWVQLATGTVESGRVAKAGDFMSGQLTTASTITVQGNAFSVGGSMFVVTGGNVGIGTMSPATKLHMSSGTLTIDGNAANGLQVFGSTFVVSSSGRVSIGNGIGGPGAVLYVGNNLSGNAISAPFQGAWTFWNPPPAPNAGMTAFVNNQGSGTGGWQFVNTNVAGTPIATPMVIAGTGNVGIGTGVPATLLDVNGAARFGSGATKSLFTAVGGLFINSGSSLTLAGASGWIASASSINASAFFGDGSRLTGIPSTASISGSCVAKLGDTMTGQLTISGSSQTIVDTNVGPSGDKFSLAVTTAADRSVYHVVVTTSGFVGVGTTAPSSMLDLQAADSTTMIKVSNNSSTVGHYPGMNIYNYSGGLAGFGSIGLVASRGSSASPAAIQSGDIIGSVAGWGQYDATPGHYYQGTAIAFSADGAFTAASAPANIRLYTTASGSAAPLERMRIASSGSVGVGTTAPAATLHVSSAATSGATLLMEISSGAVAGQQLMVVQANGNVGIGTTSPATSLDVNGVAQFGSGVTKSTFSATGALTMASGATITGNVTGSASLNVLKAGDTMTGALVLPADPTAALQAAPKQYVDSWTRACVNPADPADVMVPVGDLCIDKYEASVWSTPTGGTAYGQYPAPNTAYPCTANGQNCGPGGTAIYARSAAGVLPSSSLTWFQAAVACTNAGKHLLTNAEWQAAGAGTPDPGTGVVSPPGCNVNSSPAGPSTTGANTSCLSSYGVENAVGSLWEWTADWGQYGQISQASYVTWGDGGFTSTAWPDASYGADGTWNVAGRSANPAWTTGAPGAVIRGGSWVNGANAGVFAFNATDGPSFVLLSVGFRCGRRR